MTKKDLETASMRDRLPADKRLQGYLAGVLETELALGNRVRDAWRGGFSNAPDVLFVLLEYRFRSGTSCPPGIEYRDVNDPHYWQGEYYDRQGRQVLACGFREG